MSNAVADWCRAQGPEFENQYGADVRLGALVADQWLRDPKHVLFVLARYKFVAKMLSCTQAVAEVGAGDGWALDIVKQEVDHVIPYDIAPLTPHIKQYDVMSGPLPRHYNAIYSLDVFEHVTDGDAFFLNLSQSLYPHGKLIVGTPSLESQRYASEPSKRLHVNCMSGEDLRELAQQYFRHVFMFGMNDENIHCGFLPMCHYLFCVCAEQK